MAGNAAETIVAKAVVASRFVRRTPNGRRKPAEIFIASPPLATRRRRLIRRCLGGSAATFLGLGVYRLMTRYAVEDRLSTWKIGGRWTQDS